MLRNCGKNTLHFSEARATRVAQRPSEVPLHPLRFTIMWRPKLAESGSVGAIPPHGRI